MRRNSNKVKGDNNMSVAGDDNQIKVTQKQYEQFVDDVEQRMRKVEKEEKRSYLKIFGITVICAIVFWFLAVIAGSCFSFVIDNNGIIITLLGIIATFIVVSHYAQINSIEKRMEKQVNDIKKDCIAEIAEIESRVNKKIDEYRIEIDDLKNTIELLDGKFFNGLLKKGDFFTAKKNEFIYKIRDGYRFATNTEWDNGKYGEFIYDEANNRYKFKECLYVNEQWQRKYFDKGLYPVLACGFIAFFIRNFENTEIIKKETDYYDKYYTPLAQKYKGKEQIKLGSEARNLDAEFYEIHIKEENNNIDQSQGLLSFIIQSERDLINGYVKGYLEHIQNIAKVK